jgi:hypothetical protein
MVATHQAGKAHPKHNLQSEEGVTASEYPCRQAAGSLSMTALVMPEPQQTLAEQPQEGFATTQHGWRSEKVQWAHPDW